MNKRTHGPESEYDSPEKAAAREFAATEFDRRLRDVPRRYRKILIIDESGALQTQLMMDKGYRAQNIFVANDNPAVIASITTRLEEMGRPEVNRRGAPVQRYLKELAEKGETLHAAHLDFCGKMDDRLFETVNECAAHFAPGMVIAITGVRAREGWFPRFAAALKCEPRELPADDIRSYQLGLHLMWELPAEDIVSCRWHALDPAIHRYKGAESPMMTFVVTLASHNEHVVRMAKGEPAIAPYWLQYPCQVGMGLGNITLKQVVGFAARGRRLEWFEPHEIEDLKRWATVKGIDAWRREYAMRHLEAYEHEGKHPAD